MPYDIVRDAGACEDGKPFAVKKRMDGHIMGCHATRAAAARQLAALNANEKELTMPTPRDALAEVQRLAASAGLDIALTGEKCEMMMAEPYRFAGGATSFAELDAWREAAEAAWAARQVTWDFDELVGNIRQDEDMTPREMADAVAALAAEMADRVEAAANKELTWQDAPPAATNGPGVVTRALQAVGLRAQTKRKAQTLTHGQAAKRDVSTFRAFKDKSGQWRWLTIYTNRYRDKEGELFSDAAHKDYEAYVDRTGDLPELWYWHTPGSRMGVADHIAYDEATGFMLALGHFDKGREHMAPAIEAARAKGLAWGVSHGYDYPVRELRDGVYGAYRTYEVSILPAERAANQLTGVLIQEEPVALTEQKAAPFREAFGQEELDRINATLADWGTRAEAAGYSQKDFDEMTLADLKGLAEKATPEPPKPEAAKEAAAASTDDLLAAIKALTDPIAAELNKLGERMTVLEASDDEKVAGQFRARSSPSELAASRAASARADTRVNGNRSIVQDAKAEGEKAGDDGPDAYLKLMGWDEERLPAGLTGGN